MTQAPTPRPAADPAHYINYAELLDLRTKKFIVFGVLLALFLSALDQTIVSAALPRIVSELNGLNLYSWVTTAYLLSSAALVPIYGKLSDLYGRKPVLVFGIVVFLIGSALCGLSGEPFLGNLFGSAMMQLVVFRGLQGIGAAALATVAFAIVADLFEPRERAKYQGLFGAVFGLSSVVGPLLGGFLTDQLSWRWVFYVNVPIGLVALAVIFARMPRLASGLRGSVDYLGAVLIVIFTVPLLLALTWGADGTAGWTDAKMLALFGTSLAALLAFVFWERRHESPIVPLTLFADPTIAWTMTSRFLLGAGFLGAVLFLTLYLVNVAGFSATGAGLATLPLTLGFVIGAQGSGLLAARSGRYKSLLVGAYVVAVLAFWWLSTVQVDTPYGLLAARMFLVGLGLGPSVSLFTLAAQNAVAPYQIGVVTSVGTFFQQLGGTIGIALFGAILTSSLSSQLSTNLAAVVRDAPPQLQAQLQQFSPQGGARRSQGSFDVQKTKAQAAASVASAFDRQTAIIEAAVRSGDPARLSALQNDTRLSPEVRANLSRIPAAAIRSPQGQEQVISGLRRGIQPARQAAIRQTKDTIDAVGLAIRTSFAHAIAQIFRAGIGVMVLAFLAVLMLPDRRLDLRRPAPAAPPVSEG